MSGPIWVNVPVRLVARNTWYFTVPPRKPSSVEACQVSSRSARPAPARRALAITGESGGVVSTPAVPVMHTWVVLAGPQFPAASRPRMYTTWQEGEVHAGSTPARVCTPSVGESNAPSEAARVRPVPGAPRTSKKYSAAAIGLFPVDMSFTLAAIRIAFVAERVTSAGTDIGPSVRGPWS